MNAKEYLSQAIWLNQRINSKLEQVSSLRTLASKVNTTFGEERVQSTKKQSPMEETIVRLIDLENEVNENIDELIKLKSEIEETINQVDDPVYQLILQMRYIDRKTWEEVARNVGYDRRTIFRIHGEALKEIEKSKVVTKCPKMSLSRCGIVYGVEV